MNVHDFLGKCFEEFSFQDSHETRQDNQIDPGRFENVDVGPLGLVIKLGPEFSGIDEPGRQTPFASALKNSRFSHITDHHCDLGGHLAGGAGFSDGDHVRAPARSEHAKAESSIGIHPLFLPANGSRQQARTTRTQPFVIIMSGRQNPRKPPVVIKGG